MSKFPVGILDWPSDFKTYSDKGRGKNAEKHYNGVLDWDAMRRFPIMNMMAEDSALFAWVTWPTMRIQTDIIESWGYKYITCAFNWVKMNKNQTDKPFMGMGYWTRGNSEPCLLFTRGKNLSRLSRGVQQIVWEDVEDESTSRKYALNDVLISAESLAAAMQEAFDMWKGDKNPPTISAMRSIDSEIREGWAPAPIVYTTETIATPIQAHSVKPRAVQDRIEQLLAGPYVEFFARRQRPNWTCVGNDIDGRDIFEVMEEWK